MSLGLMVWNYWRYFTNDWTISQHALNLQKITHHKIEFFNSFVYCNSNSKLQTTPISKECDEHSYLVPTSCRPARTIRNIPYSTGHTTYKIAFEKQECELSKSQYTEFLKALDVTVQLLFRKPLSSQRLGIRVSYFEPKPEQEAKDRIFPFVTDFSPGLPILELS